jgi:hypothetical protein
MSFFTKEALKESKDQIQQNVSLHVPYEYKEQAKQLGARWNSTRKEWNTHISDINHQKLIDIFHEGNFFSNYKGNFMKSIILTEKQREDVVNADTERYNKLYSEHKELLINETGEWTKEDEFSFGSWYSVNYRHE